MELSIKVVIPTPRGGFEEHIVTADHVLYKETEMEGVAQRAIQYKQGETIKFIFEGTAYVMNYNGKTIGTYHLTGAGAED